MSKYNCYMRCPCCNDVLDEYEVSMYDIFQGMKEDCYNEAMAAAYEQIDDEYLSNEDLDREC